MWFRRGRGPSEQVSTAVIEVTPSRTGAGGPIWNDRLGRWSIRSLQIMLLLALATLFVFAMLQLTLLVIPVLIAIILAAAASPLMRFWERIGFPRMLATWVTLLGGIAVLGGIVTAIVFAVRSQWGELADSAVEGFQDLLAWVQTLPLPIDGTVLEEAGDWVLGFVTSAQFGSSAVAGVSQAAEFVTGLVLLIVVLFFLLKDGDRIWNFFLRPFDGERLARGRRIGTTAVTVLGGYMRGTAIVAFVDAVGIGIGLVILQVPLALPLSVIVFLGAFIPLVGATVAGILAALVALVANGPIVALIVVAIVIAVNQIEGDLLQPIVMAQALKLHPLVILASLTAGTILGGIVGAVLAVPITAVTWAIIKVWDKPDPSLDERRSLRHPHSKHPHSKHAAKQQPVASETAGGAGVA